MYYVGAPGLTDLFETCDRGDRFPKSPRPRKWI
jgi:hypothetical protein